MVRCGCLVLAGMISLGCSDGRNSASAKAKVTRDAPSETMAEIPAGDYLATAPFLQPGKTCTGEMRRQLDKLVDEGHVRPEAKQMVAAFAIDKQRVSCRDYLECVRQNGCKPEKNETYETLLKDDRSVCRNDDARVRADQAEAYCAWRGRQLPTFLQWQVAARGREGAGIVDAECRQRGGETDCQAISSFGVLVSASLRGFDGEITRSMDCFPVTLMGYREGEDELGRARVVAITGAWEIAGKPKILLNTSNPESVISLDEYRKDHGSQYFRCASDAPGARTP